MLHNAEPALPPDEELNPIMEFCSTVAMMAQNRSLLEGVRDHDANWTILLQDLAMLCNENASIGLRSKWVRRVVAPVWFAHRALNDDAGDEQDRAKQAVALLRECADVRVQTVCLRWLKDTYHVG